MKGFYARTRMLGVRLMAVIVLCLGLSQAYAVPIPAVEWDGNPQNVFTNGPWMMGYEFTVSDSVTVTALGAYDDRGDGFRVDHTVGIWTTAGALLASTTVTSANALLGHFRYDDIAALVLGAGTYVVGANNWGGQGDAWAWRETGGLNLIEAPNISHVQDRFVSGAGFAFPANSEGTFRDGFYGGNFMVDVPEPSTMALFGLGLLGLGLTRRRRTAP